LQGGDVSSARTLFSDAMALRQSQDMEAARAKIADAARVAPGDAQIALAHAYIAYETWQPSVGLFERAAQLAPANLPIIRSLAVAMNAEGDAAGARQLLEQALTAQHDWIDGHRALSTIRVTSGDDADFDESFAAAVQQLPDILSLRLGWFHQLATAKKWEAARKVIREAEAHFGEVRGVMLAKIFLASESDQAATDPALFDEVSEVNDVGLDLCHVRFALRTGKPELAMEIVQRHLHTPAARTFWPYASLASRQMDGVLADWLDGEGGMPFIAATDLLLGQPELNQLAATLRSLLTMQAPFLEQSVRGGVQTDRHLFFNPDPAIQSLRAKVTGAARSYIDALPASVQDHPLLSTRRDEIAYEGSWSVLLKSQGYHSRHTHNMGWISSALYVDLPPPAQLGEAPAGWIEFGMAPPELGLNLEPYQRIEPKPARLVLFPSTMWHGTVPFADGERLSVAFDVRLPV
jgi:Tfp pilus assembly protein PilF